MPDKIHDEAFRVFEQFDRESHFQLLVRIAVFSMASIVFYYFQVQGTEVVGWILGIILFLFAIVYLIFHFCWGSKVLSKDETETERQMAWSIYAFRFIIDGSWLKYCYAMRANQKDKGLSDCIASFNLW